LTDLKKKARLIIYDQTTKYFGKKLMKIGPVVLEIIGFQETIKIDINTSRT